LSNGGKEHTSQNGDDGNDQQTAGGADLGSWWGRALTVGNLGRSELSSGWNPPGRPPLRLRQSAARASAEVYPVASR
jgi:hypothetical protein